MAVHGCPAKLAVASHLDDLRLPSGLACIHACAYRLGTTGGFPC